ncbi:Lrp/AsnC family transcriptional regulator [Saccharopolyspora karakumensis]|uniref:Lrp/AsnC family transcriptional regulator n=1 Tax=Saccharopolyspora karakumensis TaxID=2530386 RepID=A0A4V2YX58_9PSEU|nr:Lrp/AsnC family transcriptional regulator [Saccharopolyspora karakumensis]
MCPAPHLTWGFGRALTARRPPTSRSVPLVNEIDALDARILLALDDDPDLTILGLSRQLGVARNTVHARLRKLGHNGVIGDFSRRVDPVALGYDLVAFVSMQISQTKQPVTTTALRELPEVIEIHATSGDADLMVKVVARDTQDLNRITNEILGIDGVERTSTAISLHEAMTTRMRGLLEVAARTS